VLNEDDNTDIFKKDASWKTVHPEPVDTYSDAMFQSKNYPDRYIGIGITGKLAKLTSEDNASRHFRVVKGLCGVVGTVSFESVEKRGQFFYVLSSSGYIYLSKSVKNNASNRKRACFIPRYNKYFEGYNAYESVEYPNTFIRHKNGNQMVLGKDDNTDLFKKDASWSTAIEESEYVYFYDNVVFESKHFPELKMGIENKNEGFLTSKNEALQHFRVVQGLCGEDGTISFESIAKSGYFLRHRGFKIFLDEWSDKDLFKKDSCFYPTYDENFEGYTSYESVNYPDKFIRSKNKRLVLETDDKSNLFKKDSSWKTTVSEIQPVSTYDNVTFESQNYPNSRMGIRSSNQGWLTTKNDQQHFSVVAGLCGVEGTISFQSVANPRQFLRHRGFKIWLGGWEDKELYKNDACFFPRYGKYFKGYTAYESVNYPNQFIRHKNNRLVLNEDDNTDIFKKDASWKTEIRQTIPVTYGNAIFESENLDGYYIGVNSNNQAYLTKESSEFQHLSVVRGLCDVAGTVSFESVAKPGWFLRHQGFKMYLHQWQDRDLYKKDACFFPRYEKYYYDHTAYESVNYPNQFIRHKNKRLVLNEDDNTSLFQQDASWRTTIPQVQQVSTYENVVLESKNYPNMKIDITTGGEGRLTSNENSEFQHFRVVQGLCGVAGTVSFESVGKTGNFLSFNNNKIILGEYITMRHKPDACFYPRYNKYFKDYTAYESLSYPNKFIRHKGFRLYIEDDDKTELFRKDASWKTVIPEVQYVSTYENAVFESKNYPNLKMGFELKPQAMLTSKRPEMQHFRVVRGVCDVEGTISFESVHYPGSFLRVMTSKKIFMYPNLGHFSEKELCFYPRYDKYFDGYTAYESLTFPNRYIRHRGFKLRVDTADGSDLFKNDASWKTKVIEVQQVSTYSDAVLESMNYPDRKMGANANQGVLTSKEKFQHFRVVQGRCGVAGTVSFESVALPGRFLYEYKTLIYFAKYKDIQRMKSNYKMSTCFYPRYNKYYKGYTAYESFLTPNKFITHYIGDRLITRGDNTSKFFKKEASWKTKPQN